MEPPDSQPQFGAPRRTKLAVAALVIALHVLVFLGLLRAFAPDFTASAVKSVVSTFTVTVTAPEPKPTPPPPARAEKPAGTAGEAGKKASPSAVAAPRPKVDLAKAPAPRAPGSGDAMTSGARDRGNGTGAGGAGDGTGSGAGGSGDGGGAATKPSVRSGQINDSRDFPVPPGGREARFGKSVIVIFTVSVDGRARDCTVKSSGVDAETTARVCPLVMQKVRFNPATRPDGTPVEARYGYRVDFSAR